MEGTIVSIDPATGFEVFDGTNWIPANGANWDEPPGVFFLIAEPIENATMWRVPNVAAWVFADGQPLGEPLEGDF